MTLRIAIVGRPNVGKSTLFNRLAGKELAIVDDTPGVTRDWREAQGYLIDQPVTLIDTAGLEEKFDESMQGRMRKQTEIALERADAILFVIDGRSGLTPMDEHFASWLRKQKKPVILAVNKCEHERAAMAGMAEAYALGFGEPVPVSAAHGHGIEELYHAFKPWFPAEIFEDDELDEDLSEIIEDELDELEGSESFEFGEQEDDNADPEKPIKIAIVGRPNVGKSTLLNTILDDERVMTGPEAGVTRDSIAVDWVLNDQKYTLVDTAGIRKKSKIQNKIEKSSVHDSLRAIRLAQIVVLVLDGNAALEKQDVQIADHIVREGRAMVIAVNKWDAVKNKTEIREHIADRLQTSLAQIDQVPIVTLSALHGKNLGLLFRQIEDIYTIWNRRTRTAELNRWLKGIESRNPAPLVSGRSNRLKYITQIKSRPPTFALWVARPKELPSSYKRYVMNALRRDFDIPGVPIRLLVRTSKNPYQ